MTSTKEDAVSCDGLPRDPTKQGGEVSLVKFDTTNTIVKKKQCTQLYSCTQIRYRPSFRPKGDQTSKYEKKGEGWWHAAPKGILWHAPLGKSGIFNALRLRLVHSQHLQ